LSSHTEPEIVSKTERITSYGYVIKNSGETVLIASIKMAFKLHKAHMEICDREKNILEKEELFRTTLESSNDGVHIIDSNFTILWINSQMIELSKKAGFDIADSTGKNLNDVFPFLDQKIIDEYNQVFETGKNISTNEVNNFQKNRFYTETNKYPVFENNKVTRVVTVIRDITNPKQIEERLRESESKMTTIFDNTQSMIIIKDKDFNISYINRKAESFLGIPQNEIIGKNDYDFYPEEDLKIIRETDNKILKTGKPVEIIETVNLGEEKLHFNSIKFPIKNQSGEITGIGGIITDISEKIKLGENNKKNKEISDSFIAAFGEIAYQWTPLKNEVIWDGNYQEILGYSDEEIGNDTNSWISRVHPDDIERVEQEVDSSILENRKYNLEYRFLKKDRTYTWMHDRGIIFLDENGNLEKIIGIFQDIHFKKVADEVLTNSLKEKESLLSELQHRVKNSLTMITSMVDIEIDNTDNEKIKKTINRISDRIMSISQLYSLLYTSESLNEIKLSEYLRNIITTLESSYSFTDKNISIKTNFDSVYLDVKRAIPMGLILTELVTNSFKHGFTDLDKGHIEILLKNTNNELKMSVNDNGVGLPKSFVINSSHSLGLKLVELLTSQIMGTLNIDTTKGTSFKLSVPV